MLPSLAHLWGRTVVSAPRVRAQMKCAKGRGSTWSSGAWARLPCGGVSLWGGAVQCQDSTACGTVQEMLREAPVSAGPSGYASLPGAAPSSAAAVALTSQLCL